MLGWVLDVKGQLPSWVLASKEQLPSWVLGFDTPQLGACWWCFCSLPFSQPPSLIAAPAPLPAAATGAMRWCGATTTRWTLRGSAAPPAWHISQRARTTQSATVRGCPGVQLLHRQLLLADAEVLELLLTAPLGTITPLVARTQVRLLQLGSNCCSVSHPPASGAVWVYCEDPKLCGVHHRECWLKVGGQGTDVPACFCMRKPCAAASTAASLGRSAFTRAVPACSWRFCAPAPHGQ